MLAIMAVVCAIVDSILEKRDYPEGAPWLYDDDLKGDNPSINGLVTWAFALITFVLISFLGGNRMLTSFAVDFRTSFLSHCTSPLKR